MTVCATHTHSIVELMYAHLVITYTTQSFTTQLRTQKIPKRTKLTSANICIRHTKCDDIFHRQHAGARWLYFLIFLSFFNSPYNFMVVLWSLVKPKMNSVCILYVVVCDTLLHSMLLCFVFSSRSSVVGRSFACVFFVSIYCSFRIDASFDENICIFYCFVMEYNWVERIEITKFEF